METKKCLTLDDAKKAAAEAEKNNWAVTIAIVDDGGHLLWLQRLHGAAPISAQIAPAKARTSALGRRESWIYEGQCQVIDLIGESGHVCAARARAPRRSPHSHADIAIESCTPVILDQVANRPSINVR